MSARQKFFCAIWSLVGTIGAQSDTLILAWDPSPDQTVVGYNLYWGPGSRTYTNVVGAGSATQASVSNVTFAAPYYFAVTAYNAAGLESDYSAEFVWQMLTNAPPFLNVRASAEGVYAGARVVLAIFSAPLTGASKFFRLRVDADQLWLQTADLAGGPWTDAQVWTNWLATMGTNWLLDFGDAYETVL